MTLFWKECRKTVCSLTFLLFAAVAVIFYLSQLTEPLKNPKTQPQPGQEGSYGTVSKDIPEVVMPAAVSSLYVEFANNSYIAYPVGFYKSVRLSGEKQAEMAQILSGLTGVPAEEILALAEEGIFGTGGGSIEIGGGEGLQPDGNGGYTMTLPEEEAPSQEENSLSPREGLTYEDFCGLMVRADRLIGGGSSYGDTFRTDTFGRVDRTYEEAMEEYRVFVEQDRVTGAYARLFCDYMGAMAALLPVFVAVAMGLRDRGARMQELIWSRRISALRLTLTRYAAMVSMLLLPFLLLAGWAMIRVYSLYSGTGLALDPLAFPAYLLGWILPSVLVSTGVGMCLTELTDTPIAAGVMLLWWFLDLNSGLWQMDGGYGGFRLMPRHNTLGGGQTFAGCFGTLAANRLFFAALGILLALLAALILEAKRRGKFRGIDSIPAVCRYRGRKSAA